MVHLIWCCSDKMLILFYFYCKTSVLLNSREMLLSQLLNVDKRFHFSFAGIVHEVIWLQRDNEKYIRTFICCRLDYSAIVCISGGLRICWALHGSGGFQNTKKSPSIRIFDICEGWKKGSHRVLRAPVSRGPQGGYLKFTMVIRYWCVFKLKNFTFHRKCINKITVQEINYYLFNAYD